MIAGQHFKTQQEEDIKNGIMTIRGGSFAVDTIYRLRKGRRARMENIKALAAAVGCDWHRLVWPVSLD
jgi:hypothetical protein